MKKIFTLAAASILAAGALSAQAQVTVDGQLTAAELTAGNYQLIGKSDNFTFTGTQNQSSNRPFGERGLLGLYVANTATKIYIFLGGTVDPGSNSFQLYMDVPGLTGVPAGTFLPAGLAGTSFEKITRIKLDQPVELALALRGDGTPVGSAPQNYRAEAAVFTSATAVQSLQVTSTTAPIVGNGTPLTLSTTASYASLNNARMAYRNTTDGKIGTNPGNGPLYTTAAYAGVGSLGWEIEIDRAALGATATNAAFRIFALYNNSNGGYASGEFIPKAATAALPAVFPSPNLGGADNGPANDVDFGVVPGLQTATFTLGASGVLSSKSADAAALALGVYPNPAAGVATVAYNVGSRAENVNVILTDLLGRQVQVLASGQQAAGVQHATVSTATVAAGTYLVRVQVGDRIATSKVVLL